MPIFVSHLLKAMGKNKLQKFKDIEEFPHVFQMPYSELVSGKVFEQKGKWHAFFSNERPIVLELGCGRGEYTVGLAERFPEKNFIGVDIKGARLWAGAKEAIQKQLTNVAFVRTHIELIPYFFAQNEISEIWLTFPDPQMKKRNKRLTSTRLMQQYEQILVPNGDIHLKTDSAFLYTYTQEMAKLNGLPVINELEDIAPIATSDPVLSIRTYYEQQWMARGITIKYLHFKLKHPVQWEEPDILIPLDEYRSYGREKRSELQLRV
ncbi:tRNA (guanine-N7-)-methyltransferase [Microbacter margulisiae]|uniref:tRNA (guanine-N(7)-)-methyltransferase n=2 Tax=Microbacter margulisiae TaxID=1350067 RepID=A0A7W5DRK5_9PORP|nr:tRNA (guanine-N7-)-methyltransferase [Microbacter margulisiae]